MLYTLSKSPLTQTITMRNTHGHDNFDKLSKIQKLNHISENQ